MKIARITLALAVLAFTAFNYGCSSEPKVGEKLEWSKIEDKSMDGKYVSIEGYAELPFLMYTDAGKSTLHLTERFNQYGGGMVILNVTDGTSPNRISPLPDDYYQTDIALYTNDGGKAYYGDKIRVSGTAKWEDGDYTIDVEMIESVSSGYDYEKEATRLTEADFTALDGKMVWAEGEVYIAEEQGTGIRMDMWMDDSTLASEVLCKIPYGPINNQADELPETYYEEDVIFRDAKGNVLGEGSRVRVYGILNSAEEMIAVEYIVDAE